MKSRKQRLTNTKRTVQIPEQTLNNLINTPNPKQLSGHTKVSTNCTIHSSIPGHVGTDKKSKSKKNATSTLKQNVGDIKKGQLSSKSNRKLRVFDIPLNVESSSNSMAEESYRQYCVVDQNFVPITKKNQHKLLEDFFFKTASSSYDFNYFNNLPKTNTFQAQKSQLRKRSISSRTQKAQEVKQKLIKVQKQDKAISNLYVDKVYVSAQIEAVADCCQIGMQYSERKQFIEQKPAQVTQKQTKINQKIQQNVAKTQQSLSELLFKLQFTHLVDDKSFNTLTSSQKTHFSQLLESIVTKLSHKQKKTNIKQMIKPILFDEIKEDQQEMGIQTYQKPANQYPFELSTPPVRVNFQKLEEMITRREYIQKNLIQDHNSSDKCINTSLLSILNFLGHFFCYIELQYSQQFVYMIRKLYGFNFREKYRRITRNMPLHQERKFRVVDESLFLDFINQSDLNLTNNNEIAHFKAIFDAFNEHLQEYRPYYSGNGQQFPWAFKLFAAMSEYSIDQDSLQIIFRQAKDKIFEWAQNLCGLLVEYEEPLPLKNPLQQKRKRKEDILINSWLIQQNFQKDGIQLFSTQALHETSQEIFNQLIQQLAKDASFLFI